MTFGNDLKFAYRSLARAKGLTVTVVLTLALGIGANAAIFSLVRGVLLRPLANRDEDRLIYIRQSAPGLNIENATFSVPEIHDLKDRVTSFTEFGDFSTIGFTMVGLGDPREVRSGVVGGSYFDVMGLHPVLGRLLGPSDDGPSAAGACVLTYRFWSTTLKRDPSVLGRVVRLGTRTATVVGVLEPSVPYPADTEIIANVVTSPHHLSATMVQGRIHRMTELFGRLKPGVTLEAAQADLKAAYQSMVQQHPEAYSPRGHNRITAVRLRDQVTSKASTVLWVLLAASGLVFVIACSNVANLVLARTVRREGELGIREALGASAGDLRRTLLAESLLLCTGGAALGILIAHPMAATLARYASRFSVRALDLKVDSSLLWVGAGLAVVASVLLAYVPRLPLSGTANGFGRGSGSPRITGSTTRRLRVFAVVQIAASFVLLAGATMLLKTLLSLQAVDTGYDTRHVLAVNVPVMSYGKTPDQIVDFYRESIRRIAELPTVQHVSFGSQVPWRDAGSFGPGFGFSAEGHVKAPGEEDPRGRLRSISPGFFATMGVPLIAGRDFNDSDRRAAEKVVMVSQSLAQRMFPNQDAVDRHIQWTDPVMKFVDISMEPRRIVGVVADVDDENVVPGPAFTIYQPYSQEGLYFGRLFVNTKGDPYSVVGPMERIIRGLSADQPVEHAATLEDIRAEVLSADRLNTLVFGGFAAVALLIAIVGVAGVLAFSVSGRTREFGIRLAVGGEPKQLVVSVMRQGAGIALAGVAVGAAAGYGLALLAGSYFQVVRMPGAAPLVASAAVLVVAALVASMLPAARAARVDVIQALRAE
ncbi:MAG TPA: ABC transporter permease [Bryobacteraceae bacterium]|jgi:predicted permease|nr:ABC transporter permease [Bryobacteraceae bacterium]